MPAIVTLRYPILNDSATNEAMVFPEASAITRDVKQVGEVRRYVGGRYRLVTLLGRQKFYTATLPGCSPEQVAWLEDHIGRTVLVRDFSGLRLWAVYLELSAEAIPGTLESSVTLSLTGVTHQDTIGIGLGF